jgi:hypothetical protein
MKLSYSAYTQLITEDIKWLLDYAPNTLERRHIIAVLEDSVKFYYGRQETKEEIEYKTPSVK